MILILIGMIVFLVFLFIFLQFVSHFQEMISVFKKYKWIHRLLMALEWIFVLPLVILILYVLTIILIVAKYGWFSIAFTTFLLGTGVVMLLFKKLERFFVTLSMKGLRAEPNETADEIIEVSDYKVK